MWKLFSLRYQRQITYWIQNWNAIQSLISVVG